MMRQIALDSTPPTLAVGDHRRPPIGRALRGTVLTAVLFFAFAYAGKEIPGLYLHAPWQDDPYDAVVSFTIFFVPLTTGLCVLRAPLCRRYEPLPVQRAGALLRGCRVVIVSVLITLGADWISVALRGNGGNWTASTALLITLLAATSTVATKVAIDLRRASRQRLPAIARDARTLDWLADLVTVATGVSHGLGPLEAGVARLVQWGDARIVTAIRRHPLAAAAIFAAGFGVLLTATVSIREPGGPARLSLFFLVGACGMYAFAAAVGAYVQFVSSLSPPRGGRRRLTDAAVAASASVPLAVAFRNSLWSIAGSRPDAGDYWSLELLLLSVAATTFVLVLGAESCARTHRA